MPTLYVVATPIGNLEDISLRALRTLREVKLIAAEDTRRTKRLLAAYDIETPMTSYHEHNKRAKRDYILDCLDGGDVALVSDAGMPGMVRRRHVFGEHLLHRLGIGADRDIPDAANLFHLGMLLARTAAARRDNCHIDLATGEKITTLDVVGDRHALEIGNLQTGACK